MRARLRLEGSLSIRCLAVMSFTRCLPDSVMLLLIFSMLFNPECLNFSYSVHSLSPSWHREGKAAHTQEMHVALPVDFWLISAVPGGSRLKPRGQGAGGRRAQPLGPCRGGLARRAAGALPLAPAGATHPPTPYPATHPLCAPTPSSGVCLP